MNIPQFLSAISDDQGAHKISAKHVIHTMSQEDFEELISEMQKHSGVIQEPTEEVINSETD